MRKRNVRSSIEMSKKTPIMDNRTKIMDNKTKVINNQNYREWDKLYTYEDYKIITRLKSNPIKNIVEIVWVLLLMFWFFTEKDSVYFFGTFPGDAGEFLFYLSIFTGFVYSDHYLFILSPRYKNIRTKIHRKINSFYYNNYYKCVAGILIFLILDTIIDIVFEGWINFFTIIFLIIKTLLS